MQISQLLHSIKKESRKRTLSIGELIELEKYIAAIPTGNKGIQYSRFECRENVGFWESDRKNRKA